jgi:hypothetical protein
MRQVQASAREGGAMPVAWEQLATLKSGAQWTISTAREHLSYQKTDPWAGYWTSGQTLTAAMKVLGFKDQAPRACWVGQRLCSRQSRRQPGLRRRRLGCVVHTRLHRDLQSRHGVRAARPVLLAVRKRDRKLRQHPRPAHRAERLTRAGSVRARPGGPGCGRHDPAAGSLPHRPESDRDERHH